MTSHQDVCTTRCFRSTGFWVSGLQFLRRRARPLRWLAGGHVLEFAQIPIGRRASMVGGNLIQNPEDIVANANTLPQPPVAIEAFWDGDTEGWFLVVVAILARPGRRHPQFSEVDLACLRAAGGDIRIFNGQVPRWPESAVAQKAGVSLACKFGVPFWFPSPDQPRDEAARWWDKDSAVPCRACGSPIVQKPGTPWAGFCHPCHLSADPPP